MHTRLRQKSRNVVGKKKRSNKFGRGDVLVNQAKAKARAKVTKNEPSSTKPPVVQEEVKNVQNKQQNTPNSVVIVAGNPAKPMEVETEGPPRSSLSQLNVKEHILNEANIDSNIETAIHGGKPMESFTVPDTSDGKRNVIGNQSKEVLPHPINVTGNGGETVGNTVIPGDEKISHGKDGSSKNETSSSIATSQQSLPPPGSFPAVRHTVKNDTFSKSTPSNFENELDLSELEDSIIAIYLPEEAAQATGENEDIPFDTEEWKQFEVSKWSFARLKWVLHRLRLALPEYAKTCHTHIEKSRDAFRKFHFPLSLYHESIKKAIGVGFEADDELLFEGKVIPKDSILVHIPIIFPQKNPFWGHYMTDATIDDVYQAELKSDTNVQFIKFPFLKVNVQRVTADIRTLRSLLGTDKKIAEQAVIDENYYRNCLQEVNRRLKKLEEVLHSRLEFSSSQSSAFLSQDTISSTNATFSQFSGGSDFKELTYRFYAQNSCKTGANGSVACVPIVALAHRYFSGRQVDQDSSSDKKMITNLCGYIVPKGVNFYNNYVKKYNVKEGLNLEIGDFLRNVGDQIGVTKVDKETLPVYQHFSIKQRTHSSLSEYFDIALAKKIFNFFVTTNGATVGIILDGIHNKRCFLFDSHARTEKFYKEARECQRRHATSEIDKIKLPCARKRGFMISTTTDNIESILQHTLSLPLDEMEDQQLPSIYKYALEIFPVRVNPLKKIPFRLVCLNEDPLEWNKIMHDKNRLYSQSTSSQSSSGLLFRSIKKKPPPPQYAKPVTKKKKKGSIDFDQVFGFPDNEAALVGQAIDTSDFSEQNINEVKSIVMDPKEVLPRGTDWPSLPDFPVNKVSFRNMVLDCPFADIISNHYEAADSIANAFKGKFFGVKQEIFDWYRVPIPLSTMKKWNMSSCNANVFMLHELRKTWTLFQETPPFFRVARASAQSLIVCKQRGHSTPSPHITVKLGFSQIERKGTILLVKQLKKVRDLHDRISRVLQEISSFNIPFLDSKKVLTIFSDFVKDPKELLRVVLRPFQSKLKEIDQSSCSEVVKKSQSMKFLIKGLKNFWNLEEVPFFSRPVSLVRISQLSSVFTDGKHVVIKGLSASFPTKDLVDIIYRDTGHRPIQVEVLVKYNRKFPSIEKGITTTRIIKFASTHARERALERTINITGTVLKQINVKPFNTKLVRPVHSAIVQAHRVFYRAFGLRIEQCGIAKFISYLRDGSNFSREMVLIAWFGCSVNRYMNKYVKPNSEETRNNLEGDFKTVLDRVRKRRKPNKVLPKAAKTKRDYGDRPSISSGVSQEVSQNPSVSSRESSSKGNAKFVRELSLLRQDLDQCKSDAKQALSQAVANKKEIGNLSTKLDSSLEGQTESIMHQMRELFKEQNQARFSSTRGRSSFGNGGGQGGCPSPSQF